MELIPTYSDGRIKIRVFGALEFDVETYKMSFWDDFDQFWLLVNLGLTMSILVNLTWNGTLSALMLERITPHQSRCFRNPMEKR